MPKATDRATANTPAVASVKRVESQIRILERFGVTIRHGRDHRDVRGDRLNVPSYSNYERAAPNTFTVADWKRVRFGPKYPGFEVDVLRADGRPANGRTTLANLRAEYD